MMNNIQKGESNVKTMNYAVQYWWYNCKGNYLCTNCHIMFGTWGVQTGKGELEIREHLECLNVQRSISQPNCDHFCCISCFRRKI